MYKYIIVLNITFIIHLYPQSDSVSIRTPKHYFKNIVLVDYYQKPKVELSPTDYVHTKLKSYQIQQTTIAFNIPVFTRDRMNTDSTFANFNFLLTGYFLSYNPNFSGLTEKHILQKNGIGIRFIYNNGKRSIFFVDFSPFSNVDKQNRSETRVIRMASLLLWSFSPSTKFNLRLGVTKSFLWGNRYYLPVIGFRIGSLNRLNFSLQFPRIMSLNYPISNKFQISLFTKPQGGVFSISNSDTLYAAFLRENKVVYLGRYEFLGGIRIDIKPVNFLGMYVSVGKSVNNYLALYSLHFNRRTQGSYIPFFKDEQGRTAFVNFGIIAYFGKTKSYYQRKNIDEMISINNEMGVGDNNLQVHSTTDNYQKKEKFKVSNEEISDLINSFDY